MATQIDQTQPNRTPTEGKLQCRKCGEWKEAQEFQSKQTQVVKYTEYCEGCRDKARQAMRLHHNRRRRGVHVSKGRPSSKYPLFPIRMVFTLPQPLVPVIEDFVNKQLQQFLTEQAKTMELDPIDVMRAFGVTSEAQIPHTHHLPQPPKPGTNQNTPRPRNDEEQQFLDQVSEAMALRLSNIARAQIAGDIKTGWQQWDNLFLTWKSANSPIGWDGPNKPLAPRTVSPEKAPST
jgi:hypothetical protein